MRLALIGVGLIGGSFARALRDAGKVDSIVGFDVDSEAVQKALELRVIDERALSAAQAVDQADLVMIATPVGAMREVLRNIAPSLPDTAVVTDVGSAKVSVIDAAYREMGAAFPRFVAGHPIAGREHSGVEHADPALFRGKVFVCTPVTQTDRQALDLTEELWRQIGCRVERMGPEEHDTVFAAVSHLPHLLAFALVRHVSAQPDAARKLSLAGTGYRDFTRIAASDVDMWRDICMANAEAISAELYNYTDRLQQLQDAIERRDQTALEFALGGNR